jgi:hypothetical protein
MIKGLMGSKGINVQFGNNSLQYINQNTANPMQGMVRVWGTDLQVFDGNSWVNMQSSYSTIELTPDVVELLEWARQKKEAEFEMKRLSETHPAIKLAVENLKKAQEQLEITTILSKEHEKTTS